ncbi:protachykinin [Hoplias malabaricus]|uniref:protachykinin n=1 Tax=Hoplias malabaricus TaxID=27720 RepID=UPI00346248E1
MKTLLLLFLLIFSFILTFSHGDHSNSEEENGTDDRYETEMKWFEAEPIQMMLKRMVRRPDQQLFYGLMGRRSSAKPQITRKRQKFQPFVGLMGKRSEEGSF